MARGRQTRDRLLAATLVLALAGGATAGCSSDDGSDGSGGRSTTTTGTDETTDSTGSTTSTAPEVDRPDGPTAAIGEPLTGGRGVSLVAADPGPDLAAVGYVQSEHAATGTAVAYASAGDLPTDGTFALTPEGSADYATRILVRRPEAAADFNGTVVVEWLNVSSGADAAPDYTYLADELVRGGYAWVGVSAQHIGIEGGPVAVEAPGAALTGAGQGLVAFDPDRYAGLSHPGDAYSYDIYTQVGRALRGDGGDNPLGDLGVERLLAVGESQSAFAHTTNANGVQPLTEAYDGFLIHSRGGAAAPLGAPDAGIDIAGTIGGAPTRVRTDLRVPTIVVETETDVLGLLAYLPARQPDSERFRLWEVAGTAHADAYQLGPAEASLGCALPVNRGQQSYVLKGALRHLDTWAASGEAPPEADRLDVDESGATPAFERDEVGNVTGGVRTPAVDAPLDVLSGLPVEGSSVICLLMGSTTPIPADALAARYPDDGDFEGEYEQATAAAIEAGFVLPEDREAILGDVDLARAPR